MAELCKVNVFFRLLLFFVVFWLCWKEDACFIHGRLMKAVMPGGGYALKVSVKRLRWTACFRFLQRLLCAGPSFDRCRFELEFQCC
jgi:hypothetical protein